MILRTNKFIKCFLILNLIQYIHAYAVEIKDIEDRNVIDKILKLIEMIGGKNEKIDKVRDLNDDSGETYVFGKRNRILVKKLIPHGYETSKFEYDAKFDTYYRPLIRLHSRDAVDEYLRGFIDNQGNYVNTDYWKNYRSLNPQVVNIASDSDKNEVSDHEAIESDDEKTINQKKSYFSEETDAESENEGKTNPLLENPTTSDESADSDFKKEPNKNLNLNNKKLSQEEAEIALEILRDFRNLIEGKDIMFNKKKRDRYKRLVNDLKKSGINTIRTYERSGEEHDPLAPGKRYPPVDTVDLETQKPKKWYPRYSYWDYWTYGKSLYDDECKGSSIRINDVCIWTPH